MLPGGKEKFLWVGTDGALPAHPSLSGTYLCVAWKRPSCEWTGAPGPQHVGGPSIPTALGLGPHATNHMAVQGDQAFSVSSSGASWVTVKCGIGHVKSSQKTRVFLWNVHLRDTSSLSPASSAFFACSFHLLLLFIFVSLFASVYLLDCQALWWAQIKCLDTI